MIVKMKDVIKKYDELVALDSFSIEIAEGEIYGLLGPNGSGKSTAISCMLSLIKYEKGEVEVFGEPMSAGKLNIKEKIGYVPQDLAFFPELKVWENIDFFCGLYVKDKKKKKEMVDEAIRFVELEQFRNFTAKKLSGGLKRRLNIACGIAHKPQLIIFDEPTVAVDPQSRNNILEGIKKLNREGATILYTSHYMEEVEHLCHTISVMDRGHNLITGTKETLKESVGLKDKVVFTEFRAEESVMTDLKSLSFVSGIEADGSNISISLSQKKAIGTLLSFVDEHGAHYESMSFEQPTLNDVFLEITGKELRDSVDE